MPDKSMTVRRVGGEARTAFPTAWNVRQRARAKRRRVAIFIRCLRRLCRRAGRGVRWLERDRMGIL